MEIKEALDLKGEVQGKKWSVWSYPVIAWVIVEWVGEGFIDALAITKSIGLEADDMSEDIPKDEGVRAINAIPATPGTYKLKVFIETGKDGYGTTRDFCTLIPEDIASCEIEDFKGQAERIVEETLKELSSRGEQ